MAVSEELRTLVEQLPKAGGDGKYNTDIDKEKIEKTIAQIHQGGKPYVLGLIEMLDQPGSEKDVKPHYALHCLANCVLQSRDEQARRDFAEVLAGQLGSDRSKYIRGYLCQELQWAGRRDACPALGKLLGRRRPGRPGRDGLGGHPRRRGRAVPRGRPAPREPAISKSCRGWGRWATRSRSPP